MNFKQRMKIIKQEELKLLKNIVKIGLVSTKFHWTNFKQILTFVLICCHFQLLNIKS